MDNKQQQSGLADILQDEGIDALVIERTESEKEYTLQLRMDAENIIKVLDIFTAFGLLEKKEVRQ